MKRLFVSIVVLLCMSSVAFAAPKKKKKAEPKMVIDEESCTNKAIDFQELVVTNPYDTKGKCYWIGFPMMKQQLLSRSVALAVIAVGSSPNIFALVEFGDESVPMGPFYGLFMGLGAYEYGTVSGSVNTVHHLKKLKDYLKSTKKPKPDVKEQPTETTPPKGEQK